MLADSKLLRLLSLLSKVAIRKLTILYRIVTDIIDAPLIATELHSTKRADLFDTDLISVDN